MRTRGLVVLAAVFCGVAGLQAEPASAGLAPLVVNTTAGDDDGLCQTLVVGDCSLPDALAAAVDTQLITFDIPDTDAGCNASGVCRIEPLATLRNDEVDFVTIAGYTQDGASQNTQAIGNDAELKIVIDGSSLPPNAAALSLEGTSWTVSGLVINDLADSQTAIRIVGSTARVFGNFLGTNVAGGALAGAGATGIFIDGDGASIGETGLQNRNLIAGFEENIDVFAAADAAIMNNYVGTNANGTIALGGGSGVSVFGANTQIGGTENNAGNLISGHTGPAITAAYGHGMRIQGNRIGTNALGTQARPNGGYGITAFAMEDFVIGGLTPNGRNVISGNASGGIELDDPPAGGSVATIRGNYIGTNAAGTAAIPNDGPGVLIENAASVTIGGPTNASRNVISGNDGPGIEVQEDANEVVIERNRVGTNAAGDAAVPNTEAGVFLTSPEATVAVRNNLVSGNGANGIYVYTPGTTITGNSVGTDAAGTADVGNVGNGIIVGVEGVQVGGTGGGEGNQVAFNGEAGVLVSTSGANRATGGPLQPAGVSILGNRIHDNGDLGIDLEPDEQVNTNDEDDPDSGANNGQNWPVLLNARQGSTKITGVLNSNPSKEFRIEFFASGDCDASGNGEGAQFLGSATATTNASGNAAFSVTTPVTVPKGAQITSTATDLLTGDTSEFSNCVDVEPAPTPEPTLPPGETPTPTPKGLTPTPTDIPIETEGPTPTEPAKETEAPEPTPTATPTPGPTGTGSTPTPTATVTPTPLPSGVTPEPTPTVTPTPTAGPSETPGAKSTQGDVQCDGDVDTVDALQQLRAVAALETFQEDGCPAIGSAGALFGDVDCDGDVDSVDALKVLRHVAALSVTQTEPCADIGDALS